MLSLAAATRGNKRYHHKIYAYSLSIMSVEDRTVGLLDVQELDKSNQPFC